MMKKRKKHMGKSCSKIILLILILAAWIVVTVRAKKTEEGIILTDAYKKQIMESVQSRSFLFFKYSTPLYWSNQSRFITFFNYSVFITNCKVVSA